MSERYATSRKPCAVLMVLRDQHVYEKNWKHYKKDAARARPVRKAGRLGRVARVPPREGHVFKTKARAPTLVLLETVDDPDADTTCLREEDSESEKTTTSLYVG